MAQLQKGYTYSSTNNLVDISNLNNLVDAGTILSGAITEQASKATVVGGDTILIADSAASNALKKTTLSGVFGTSLPIGSTAPNTGAFTTLSASTSLSSLGATALAGTSGNVNVGFSSGLAQSKLHVVHDSSSVNGITITDTNATGAVISASGITITSSGTTATVTYASHGLVVGDTIVISNVTETAYNGVFAVVTVPTTGTFTYTLATAASASPATGSRSYRKVSGANYQIGGNSSSAGKLFFKDLNLGTNTLTIDSAGNVGINNIAPTAKLDVTGNLDISTDVAIGTAATSKAITGIAFSATTATVTTSAAHGFTTGDFIRISGASQSVYNGSFVIGNATPTGTTFTYTLPSTPTAASTACVCYKDNFANITGNAFASGRVGIGTVAPSTELHVSGSALITGQITSPNILSQRTFIESATAVPVAGANLANGTSVSPAQITSAYGTLIAGLKVSNFIPKSTTSKIKVLVKGKYSVSGGGTNVSLALYKVANASTFPPVTAINAIAAYSTFHTNDATQIPIVLEYEYISGSLDAIDFNLMFVKDSNAATFNTDVFYLPTTKASIEVTEYFQ